MDTHKKVQTDRSGQLVTSTLTSDTIMSLLNRRIGHVLDAAELGLSADAFKVFRRIVLKQFGADELGADIERLFARSAAGTDRNGQGRN